MKHPALCGIIGGLALFALSTLGQTEAPANRSEPVVVDASELNRQLLERREKISQLSPEEREALEKARANALRDPAVQEARARRDQALREFQEALYSSMLKADPTLRVILQKTHTFRAPNP